MTAPNMSLPFAIVFTSLATAKSAITAIDTALGYPIAGTNVGAGTHPTVPPCSASFCQIWQHPMLANWAIVIPQSKAAQLAQILATAGIVAPAAAVLDSTWPGFSLAWPLASDIAAAQAKVGPTAVATKGAPHA